MSVFTNLMGTTLEREFKIEGDLLTIRTVPPEKFGQLKSPGLEARLVLHPARHILLLFPNRDRLVS